jgi:hypothetical protein
MTRSNPCCPAFVLAIAALLAPSDSFGDDLWIVTAQAGGHRRIDTPVRFDVPDGPVAASLARRMAGSATSKTLALVEVLGDGRSGESIPAQVDPTPSETGAAVRLTWIMKGETAAGSERRYRFDAGKLEDAPSPWSLSDPSAGAVELAHGKRPVLRYNIEPVSNPRYKAIQNRNAYIHPAYTPSGALITGDFSKFHPHHRGFFLAYTKTQVGKLHPDFWNIHGGSGKIVFDGLDRTRVGPVTASFGTRHRWEATGGGTVLRERWEVEAFDIPGSPFWMFDVTAAQQAVGEPFELLPYRYGGMAYRGPEPFVKGALDVLTSAGLDRRTADQKPARWVDLTGPVSEGSDRYGGAMILDHPANVNHPSVARIHPTSLPFFCYVPGHDVKVTIDSKKPSVFRYRVVIHDGRPDAALDERLWRDFAEPVRVALSRAAVGD